MRAFAYQWSQRKWKDRIGSYSGRPVPYCGSNQFRGVGFLPGDTLYVYGFGDGREGLLLIGRFVIAAKAEVLCDSSPREAVLDPTEARVALGDAVYGVPLYDADWYVVPRDGTATDMRFDREVPLNPPLLFGKPGQQPRQLFIDADGRINRQAIRTVSRLRTSTVAAFDRVLDRDE
jgi:hypothetical protein